MQRQPNLRVLLNQRKKCVIRMLVALFENVFEITGRLVGVDNQYNVEGGTG